MSAAPGDFHATGAAFPWNEAMRAGLGILRLPPGDFWTMTPRELAAAFAVVEGPAPTTRADLEHLMRLFPDGGSGVADRPSMTKSNQGG